MLVSCPTLLCESRSPEIMMTSHNDNKSNDYSYEQSPLHLQHVYTGPAGQGPLVIPAGFKQTQHLEDPAMKTHNEELHEDSITSVSVKVTLL
jgi:hypothetical protein